MILIIRRVPNAITKSEILNDISKYRISGILFKTVFPEPTIQIVQFKDNRTDILETHIIIYGEYKLLKKLLNKTIELSGRKFRYTEYRLRGRSRREGYSPNYTRNKRKVRDRRRGKYLVRITQDPTEVIFSSNPIFHKKF